MKKKLRRKSGITLIALVITVIIMLILAGVAISVLTSDEGLFDKTRNAADAYEKAAQNEADRIQSLMNDIDNYLNGLPTGEIDTTAPTVATIEASNITGTSFTLTATGVDLGTEIEKYEFYINGILEKTVTTTEGTATYNVTEKAGSTTYTCKVRVYNKAGKYKESEEISVNTNSVIGVLNKQNQTYDGQTTGTYNNPIIPKGFAPMNENGANWGTAEGYKYGLVITDEVTNAVSTGNEFVWVPVDGTIVTFERKTWYKSDGTTIVGLSADDCSETLIDDLKTTVENSSINRNGGFYIARYEAGIATGMTKLTSDSTATYGGGAYKPVSKQGATVWNYIKWGTNNSDSNPGNGAVTVARSMYLESERNYGAVSTLIYGVQWDAALKFIQAYNTGEAGYSTYATNSAGYGNYSGTDGKGDTFTSTTEPTICGAATQFRQKNIYDMAGNVWDSTMESYGGSNRVGRGGSYRDTGSDYPAASRGNSGSFSDAHPNVGFRCALYVKSQTES